MGTKDVAKKESNKELDRILGPVMVMGGLHNENTNHNSESKTINTVCQRVCLSFSVFLLFAGCLR